MAVQIFSDINYAGAVFGPTEQQEFLTLDSFWNDKISSVKICSGTWQFFEHANYQGRNFQLQPGNYPTLDSPGSVVNHTISSFRKVG